MYDCETKLSLSLDAFFFIHLRWNLNEDAETEAPSSEIETPYKLKEEANSTTIISQTAVCFVFHVDLSVGLK